MLVNTLLVAFAALGAVAAIPNPNLDANNVDLQVRDRQPDCGREATYDRERRECVCRDHGMDFDSRSKTCACPKGEEWNGRSCEKHHGGNHPRNREPDCGREATYDRERRECVCKDHGMDFDSRSKTCACPKGEEWNGRSCEKHHGNHPRNREPDCGRDATYDRERRECVCKNHGMDFNSRTKSCACPKGEEWNGRSCEKHHGNHPRNREPDCGRDATYDRERRECVCKKHGMDFNSREKSCACPRGKKYDEHKKTCH